MPLRVLLLGASGTMGIATARALVDRGYHVTSVVRPPSVNSTLKIAALQKQLSGTEIRWCDASDATALR